jgi:hypothetical protein
MWRVPFSADVICATPHCDYVPVREPQIPRFISWLVLVTVVSIVAVFLIGCHKKPPVVVPPEIRTVEVSVPVPVKVAPPAELLAAVKPRLPVFVSPSDPQATSGLTAEGERMLRGLIEELLGRLEAWKAWATTP